MTRSSTPSVPVVRTAWGAGSRSDLVGRTYRALHHGDAPKRLQAAAALTEPGSVLRLVSSAFNDLQGRRHEADDERPTTMSARKEARAHLGKAKPAVGLLGTLDEGRRRSLAVDLLVAPRRPA